MVKETETPAQAEGPDLFCEPAITPAGADAKTEERQARRGINRKMSLSTPPASPRSSPPTDSAPEPVPGPKLPPYFGANNTIFTKEAADEAREILRRKLGQLRCAP